MYTHFGITYTALGAAPSFAQACIEAEQGRATSEVQHGPERVMCLSVMKYWKEVPESTGELELSVKLTAQEMVFTGTSSRFSANSMVSYCIRNLEEGAVEPPPAEKTVMYVRHAVCYLAYAMSNGSNQTNYVRQYRDKCLAAIPPENVTCLHCLRIFPYTKFRGDRINSISLAKDSNGTRWLCKQCAENHFAYSVQMRVFLNTETEELVWPSFLIGPVTNDYAERHYYCDGGGTWHRERPREIGLQNYSCNPFNFARWDERNPLNALVFGVELEMEPRFRPNEEKQGELVALLGGGAKEGRNYILKSDASLSYGVELVTMPFTLEQHKKGDVMPWEALLNKINQGTARSGANTDACGMHVHINKAALSALTIGKMLVFLNSENLSPLISTIAQRGAGSYCSRDKGKKVVDGAKSSSNRYDIMNVSVVHPTCEVRMFKGNLRPERIYKNLEFCHALVQYCRATSLQDLSDWGNFTRWLLAKRGQYPCLVQFLIDKNAVGFRKMAKEANEHFTHVMIEEV